MGDLGGVPERLLPTDSYLDSATPESLDLYLGIHKQKLRYFNLQGELLMSPEEAALDAQRRSEQLAAQLRSLGVVPDA